MQWRTQDFNKKGTIFFRSPHLINQLNVNILRTRISECHGIWIIILHGKGGLKDEKGWAKRKWCGEKFGVATLNRPPPVYATGYVFFSCLLSLSQSVFFSTFLSICANILIYVYLYFCFSVSLEPTLRNFKNEGDQILR